MSLGNKACSLKIAASSGYTLPPTRDKVVHCTFVLSWGDTLDDGVNLASELIDISKSAAFEVAFDAGKQPVVCGGNVWRIGWVGQDLGVVAPQVLSDSSCAVGRCAIMLEVPPAIHPHLGPPVVQGSAQAFHYSKVDISADAQTLIEELAMNHSLRIEETNQHEPGCAQVAPGLGRTLFTTPQP